MVQICEWVYKEESDGIMGFNCYVQFLGLLGMLQVPSGFHFLMDPTPVDSCFRGDRLHCILSFPSMFLGHDFTMQCIQKQNWLNFYYLTSISAHCPLEYSGTNLCPHSI